MTPAPWPRRAWPYRLLVALCLVALPYGCAGYVMTGSLQPAYAYEVALAYLGLMACAVLGLVVGAVALYRVATRRPPGAGTAG